MNAVPSLQLAIDCLRDAKSNLAAALGALEVNGKRVSQESRSIAIAVTNAETALLWAEKALAEVRQ